MNYAIVGLAVLALIIVTIKTFAFQTTIHTIKHLIGFFFIFILVLLLISLYKNSISLKIHAILLNYGSQMIKERWLIIIYIIIYSVMFVLFIGLVLFQFAGYWTGGRTIFIPAQFVYYQLRGLTVSTGVTIVLAIQFVWGAGFLKQSCKFIVIQIIIAYLAMQSHGSLAK